jgi:lipoprotein-anchoring transpeptidase ErfK/SrfK
MRVVLAWLPVLALLSACGDGSVTAEEKAGLSDGPAASAQVQPPVLKRSVVDQAEFSPDAVASQDRTPAVLRAQVLLDRARFSPGVIDGKPGENVRQAIAAFEEANGLPTDGQLDEAVFRRLTEIDSRPALKEYVIAPEDVAGPFVDRIPTDDLEAMSKLPALSYTGPAELLGEKFHMTPELIQALNPGADLTKAGTRIVVANTEAAKLEAPVQRIEVHKAERAVRAFSADGKLLAFYPATIGSDERPAPSGELKVLAVAPEPTYTFDPKRLTYKGPKTKVTIPAGPNSPVGSVWIDLSEDTYGIHGSSEPKEIGKRFSHGCVRLTNWDAEALAAAVRPGARVSFVG